jgi:SAM-dependent methyltransferase
MNNAPLQLPHLFNRTRLRARRAKYASNAPEFFNQFLIDETGDRLSMIKREFADILITSAVPGLVNHITKLETLTRPIIMDMCAQRLSSETGPAIVGDEEELPIANESLSCIISLLSLQFINDLPGALIQMRRALKPDGLFLAAMLGGDSLRELREVFLQAESELCSGVAPRVAPFAEVRDCGALLQRAGFALPVCDSDRIIVRYDSMFDLMQDLRHFGWANAMTEHAPGLMRRDVLAQASALYEQNFSGDDGRLRATFQFIWMTGWAPHESQQQPLKPGSAKMRLADALGTRETVVPNSSDDGSFD